MPSTKKPTPATEAPAEADAPADQAPSDAPLDLEPPQPETSQTTATPATGDDPPTCPPGGHTYKTIVNLDGSPISTFNNQRCTNCSAERRLV